MSFVRKLVNVISGPKDYSSEVSKILPLADCSFTCDSSECHSKYPSSLKVDEEAMREPLWESTKPYALHMLISTGKTDWPHDALDVPGTVLPLIGEWGGSNSRLVNGNIKVTVSSLDLPMDSPNISEYQSGKMVDVLLLPFFVWCKGLTVDNYSQVLNELIPLLVELREEKNDDFYSKIPKDIKGVKIEIDSNHSYVFLCSHRTRDKRCGITAPIMKKEFDLNLRDLDLYRDFGDDRPNGVKVGFVNHVGGHKFAANVIVYNRTGENAWFAKCTPLNVKPIINETILGGGKVWPDSVRIVQKFNPISW